MQILKSLLLMSIPLTLLFTGCQEDDEVVSNILEVSADSIFIEADKKTGAFALETDAESWEIDNPASDWLSLSKTSGNSSKAMISLVVDGKTPEQRSAKLTIHAGDAAPVQVSVIQASSEYVYELEINTNDITLPVTGGSKTFEISTSAPQWSIESNADWLTIDNTSGSDSEATITLAADKNDTGNDRSVILSVVADYTPTKEITIKQDAAFPSYNTSPAEPDMTGVEKTASQLAAEMTIGWNIGNTLEVPDGETGWGNPKVDQQLIDSVKAAGFNTIRIPCAWNSYANPSTAEIQESWLARVKEVVDYCMANDMFVILNSHWDGGWLEEHPTYDKQEEVNMKHQAYWEQIATYFRDYDERLLFAGTNEVRANYNAPSNENIEVQESYNQTFVDAVRSTGGKNVYRNLIVQTYNTNIEHGLNHFTPPEDDAENRLFVEVHYYDPYEFTLKEDGNTLWGEPFQDGDVSDWGQEDHVDNQFARLKSNYVDKGMPVVLGEYGAVHRSSLSGEDYEKHVEARSYYLEYVTNAAVENGIIPVYWDNGHDGNNGFALFNRSDGAILDSKALNALLTGAGVAK